MEKRTPLYDVHVAAGGKIVPFAGFELPVEYPTGLMKEHEAVRTACGLFDVSHMGEVTFEGEGALATLNHLMTNDFTEQPVGKCRYSALCYEDGGMVDDLIVYRRAEDCFLVVVNAANKDKDVAWMRDHLLPGVVMTDISDDVAQIALQGPASCAVLARITAEDSLPTGYYTFTEHVDLAGVDCLVSRTGYTGEDGFEIYCAPTDATAVWSALMEAGADEGIMPCGLGARDTLRLEAAMPLYGHEMDETVDPLEAGLGFAVKMDKEAFVGRDALAEKGAPARERIGLEVVGRGIVREHESVFFEGRQIGHTTSGTFCPHLKKACAMALVETGALSVGDEAEVEVRGRRVAVRVVGLPFYRRQK